jgi:hypothetical protein
MGLAEIEEGSERSFREGFRLRKRPLLDEVVRGGCRWWDEASGGRCGACAVKMRGVHEWITRNSVKMTLKIRVFLIGRRVEIC